MLDTSWDWDKISFELPREIKLMIQAIPTALTSRGSNKLAWAGFPQGNFDLRSAYRIVIRFEDSPPFLANWIWKADTFPRIKTLLWMCAHNSIGVKACFKKKGVVEENICPICQRAPETILRALRDCPQIKPMWTQLGINTSKQTFWRSNLQYWLTSNGRLNCKLLAMSPP